MQKHIILFGVVSVFFTIKRSYLTQNESENMCVFYGIYRICRWVLSVQHIWCWQSQGLDYPALKPGMIRMVYLEHVVVCHDANFVVVVVIGILDSSAPNIPLGIWDFGMQTARNLQTYPQNIAGILHTGLHEIEDFPHEWPSLRGTQWWPVDTRTKGQ